MAIGNRPEVDFDDIIGSGGQIYYRNRDESSSSIIIITDGYLFNNFPDGPGEIILDKNIYPFVKIDNIYYVNDGGKWGYDNGRNSASMMHITSAYSWKQNLLMLKYARGLTKTSSHDDDLLLPLATKEKVYKWTLNNYRIKNDYLQLQSWEKVYSETMDDGNFLSSLDKPSNEYNANTSYFGLYPKIICVAENFSKTNTESGSWQISLTDTNITVAENGSIISNVELKPNSLVLLIQRKPQDVSFKTGVTLYTNELVGSYYKEPTTAGLWVYLQQNSTGLMLHPLRWVFSGGIFSAHNSTHYSSHSSDFTNSLSGIRLRSGATYNIDEMGNLSTYSLQNLKDIFPSYISENQLFYRSNLTISLPAITGLCDIADGKGSTRENAISARIGDAMSGRLPNGQTRWRTVSEIRKESNYEETYKMTGGFSTNVTLTNFPRPLLVDEVPSVFLGEVNCYNNTKGDTKQSNNDILIYNSVTGWINAMTRGLFKNSISLIDSNNSNTISGESSIVDGDNNTLYYTKKDGIVADGHSGGGYTKPAYWRLKYYCGSATEYSNAITPRSISSNSSPTASTTASVIYIVEPPIIQPANEYFSFSSNVANNTLNIIFENNTNSNVEVYFNYSGYGTTTCVYSADTLTRTQVNINEAISQADPYFQYTDPITGENIKKYFSELV